MTDHQSTETHLNTETPTAHGGRRTARRAALVGAVAAGLALVPAGATEAAPPTRIDVTVAESLSGSAPGTVTDDTGLEAFGCDGASVATPSASASTSGPITTFTGTKEIACTSGTLTLAFSARVNGCSTTDRGVWRVIGGTGAFAGATGRGTLVGTYTGGAGTACDNTGIDDRYRGVIRVP